MGAMCHVTPFNLVHYTLPELIHCFRAWQRAKGIDPDAAIKNPPMTRKRMKRLFDQHAQAKNQTQQTAQQTVQQPLQ